MSEPIHRACWSEDRALAVLQTVALANSEAEFLAVHQPIRDFQVTSPAGLKIDPTDEALLQTLSNPETRYAFCVVEGEPGAGKSHLIRWLKVKWNDRDLVMLIERADGSLTGTLRQLREGLGARYAHLFENLAQSVEASFEGRVKLFHANLSASLAPTFFEKPIGDEEWCKTWELERLIGHPTIQEKWKGPERILKVMSGDGGQRNSSSASFDLYDIADLAGVQAAVEGLPPKAVMLLRSLKREADRIAPSRAQGVSAQDLALDETLDLPQSRKILEALNLRRNFAVQQILGITVDGLRDMFIKLRKELLKEGRRLVLLLEDVTSWEGIDGQLIDSLVVDARTREDVCDLVSVVGMTPLYLRGMQGNYGARITYILRLGRSRQEGGFQETIQLAEATAQTEFASRYLRAVRIERPELEAWHSGGADPSTLPNKCESCGSRVACFAAFGSVNEVGLFPFNANAITNMFSLLEDPKGTQSLQTPRGMIQGVLSPVLMHPTRLDSGGFPPIEIESSEWMPERQLQPNGFLKQVIDAAETDPARQGQLRRLVMLWGNRESDIRVIVHADGVRTVTGVAEGVFQTFGLPWLGEGLDVNRAGSTISPPTNTPPSAPSPPPDPILAPPPSGGGRGQIQSPPINVPRPTQGPRPQGTTPTVSAGRLKTLSEQAQQWRDGKPISDPSIWEVLLSELMAEVRKLLPDPAPGLWERVFTRDAVKLEGSGRTDARHFVIPREDWAKRGIEAYLQVRSNAELQPIQLESNRRAIARMLRRLTELSASQLSRRLALEDGRWSVSGATAQVLLARAWLRGTVSPDAPLEDQFQELLSDEQDPRSMPDERVDSWGELVKATGYWHDKLRSLLRQTLLLPLGTGAALMNAGEIASALQKLRLELRTVDLPAKPEFSRGLEEIAKLVDLAKQTDDQLRYIPDREYKSLEQRKERVMMLLRQSNLSHHIECVDKALERTATSLLGAAPVERHEYAQSRQRIAEMSLLDESSPAWTRLADYLLEDEPGHVDDAARLAYVLDVPIASLKLTLDTLDKAERAVRAAYKYAQAYVDGNQTEGDLSVVQSFGQRLAGAAEDLQSRLTEVE